MGGLPAKLQVEIDDIKQEVLTALAGLDKLSVSEQRAVVKVRLREAMDVYVENPNGDNFRALRVMMYGWQEVKLNRRVGP